jgi:hypothetical protein
MTRFRYTAAAARGSRVRWSPAFIDRLNGDASPRHDTLQAASPVWGSDPVDRIYPAEAIADGPAEWLPVHSTLTQASVRDGIGRVSREELDDVRLLAEHRPDRGGPFETSVKDVSEAGPSTQTRRPVAARCGSSGRQF